MTVKIDKYREHLENRGNKLGLSCAKLRISLNVSDFDKILDNLDWLALEGLIGLKSLVL